MAGDRAWSIDVRVGDTTLAYGEDLPIPTVAPLSFRTMQVGEDDVSAGSRPMPPMTKPANVGGETA